MARNRISKQLKLVEENEKVHTTKFQQTTNLTPPECKFHLHVNFVSQLFVESATVTNNTISPPPTHTREFEKEFEKLPLSAFQRGGTKVNLFSNL